MRKINGAAFTRSDFIRQPSQMAEQLSALTGRACIFAETLKRTACVRQKNDTNNVRPSAMLAC